MNDEAIKEGEELKLPQNKILWIFGGLILLIVAWFGYKTLISSVEDYRIVLIDAPKEISSGSTATFTWDIAGPPTTINHTSVHLGTTSNPGELGKEVKQADTKYTEMVADFANGTYNVPLRFVGNIQLMSEGKYYFRAHGLVKDKNYWSDEFSLNVVKATTSGEYKISILYPPKSVSLSVLPTGEKEATTGGLVNFTWRIDGPPAIINHTSIYYGLVSNTGVFDDKVAPSDTKYTDFVKDFANGKYNIPLQFVGNTNIISPGTYYYRAYALVNGKNIWSNEYSFTAK